MTFCVSGEGRLSEAEEVKVGFIREEGILDTEDEENRGGRDEYRRRRSAGYEHCSATARTVRQALVLLLRVETPSHA